MNWLGLAADVKVRQKIQKNPKRNKIKEETKKIKIPTCEIILMRGGGDPDLGDKSSVSPFSSSFGGIETKSQTQECERTESSRWAHSLCFWAFQL